MAAVAAPITTAIASMRLRLSEVDRPLSRFSRKCDDGLETACLEGPKIGNSSAGPNPEISGGLIGDRSMAMKEMMAISKASCIVK
jgi:hypothetical protein